MNFVNYPHPYKMPSLNTQSIQKQLNDNNKLIKDAYIQQCSENYEKSFEILEKLTSSLLFLGENADKQSTTYSIVRDHREILSKTAYDEFNTKNQVFLNNNNNNVNYSMNEVIWSFSLAHTIKKQQKKSEKKKNLWSKEEHKLFLEALEQYGKKDLKKISEYIKTRSSTQVRSHLQKHLKKMQKKSTSDQPIELNNE